MSRMVRITAANSSTFYSSIPGRPDRAQGVIRFLLTLYRSGQENKVQILLFGEAILAVVEGDFCFRKECGNPPLCLKCFKCRYQQGNGSVSGFCFGRPEMAESSQVLFIITVPAKDQPDNMSIWRQIMRTNPRYTKALEGTGFDGTSINAEYMIMRATEMFGPIGSGWPVHAAPAASLMMSRALTLAAPAMMQLTGESKLNLQAMNFG